MTVGVAGELGFTYKASRVETNLRDNNHKIEESLNISAETAATAADRAKASADAAGIEAGKAETTAGNALSRSNKANAAASNALSEAAELRASLKAAENELNEEHNKRIELEKSLTPRSPFAIRVEKGKAQLPDLTGFQDMKFDLVLIHDAEAVRAAGAILTLLTTAGWTRGTTTFVEYGMPETPEDGVSVSWFLAPRRYNSSIPETEEIVRSWMRCEAAGLGLIVFLEDHDWEARESRDMDHNVQNTIRIKIGFMPNPYFSPFKGTSNQSRQAHKEMLKSAQKDLRESGEHPWLWPQPEPPKP